MLEKGLDPSKHPDAQSQLLTQLCPLSSGHLSDTFDPCLTGKIGEIPFPGYCTELFLPWDMVTSQPLW